MRLSRIALAAAFAASLGAGGPSGVHTPLFQYLMVGARRVAFEAPTGRGVAFASVAKILGGKPAMIVTPTICYALTGPAPRMILVFYGDDMGSDGLEDFNLTAASDEPELAGKCNRLDVAASQVATDRGVRLALTRADVESKLGKAESESDGKATYEATEERTGKDAEGNVAPYRLNSEITVIYRKGKVVAFRGGIGGED